MLNMNIPRQIQIPDRILAACLFICIYSRSFCSFRIGRKKTLFFLMGLSGVSLLSATMISTFRGIQICICSDMVLCNLSLFVYPLFCFCRFIFSIFIGFFYHFPCKFCIVLIDDATMNLNF